MRRDAEVGNESSNARLVVPEPGGADVESAHRGEPPTDPVARLKKPHGPMCRQKMAGECQPRDARTNNDDIDVFDDGLDFHALSLSTTRLQLSRCADDMRLRVSKASRNEWPAADGVGYLVT